MSNNNDSSKGCLIYFVCVIIFGLVLWGAVSLFTDSNPYSGYECEWGDCTAEAETRIYKSGSSYPDYYCSEHVEYAHAENNENDDDYGLADYIKDQDPDLYDSMKDRYDSLK